MLLLSGCVTQSTPVPSTLDTPSTITGYVAPTAIVASPMPNLFNGERAYQLAATLMAFGPRVTGSDANRRAGDWILQELAVRGWNTFTDEGTAHGVVVRNLAGQKGAGPVVILAAHYDSRMRADRDPVSTGEPVPGAEDSVSGVVVLLELARILAPEESHRQVWLVFLDAEDNGDLDGWDWAVGARQFALRVDQDRQAGVPLADFILLDMVGDCDQQFYYEGNSDPGLREQIWNVAAGLGYSGNFIPAVKYTMIDDHLPFRVLGIPAVDIIDFDYPYWHTRADTLDKLCAASLERIGRTLVRWLGAG